jgi:hypothetical protein
VAEDRRLAMAAVIMSGIVGFGAPVLSMLAARSIQNAAFRNERVQADRTELRSVLDRAAVEVTSFQVTTQDAASSWYYRTRARYRDAQRLRRGVFELRRNYYRLRLRLGAKDPAVRSYGSIYRLAGNIADLVHTAPSLGKQRRGDRMYQRLRCGRSLSPSGGRPARRLASPRRPRGLTRRRLPARGTVAPYRADRGHARHGWRSPAVAPGRQHAVDDRPRSTRIGRMPRKGRATSARGWRCWQSSR